MKRILFCFFTLFEIGTALGQETGPSDDLLFLYKMDQSPRKYVLCVNYDSPGGGKDSFVVMGDTFAVLPPRFVKPGLTACDVVMSNVCVLNTKIERSVTNKVSQIVYYEGGKIMDFPEHTKVVFNNSVVELSKFKIRNSK